MIPDGRDCKLNNGTSNTMNMNGNKPTTNNKPKEKNKENVQNASNIDEKKNSLIETEVASEISTEMKENKIKVQKPPMVYKLVLTGGPCSG